MITKMLKTEEYKDYQQFNKEGLEIPLTQAIEYSQSAFIPLFDEKNIIYQPLNAPEEIV
jgi:hypothetical protein